MRDLGVASSRKRNLGLSVFGGVCGVEEDDKEDGRRLKRSMKFDMADLKSGCWASESTGKWDSQSIRVSNCLNTASRFTA